MQSLATSGPSLEGNKEIALRLAQHTGAISRKSLARGQGSFQACSTFGSSQSSTPKPSNFSGSPSVLLYCHLWGLQSDHTVVSSRCGMGIRWGKGLTAFMRRHRAGVWGGLVYNVHCRVLCLALMSLLRLVGNPCSRPVAFASRKKAC